MLPNRKRAKKMPQVRDAKTGTRGQFFDTMIPTTWACLGSLVHSIIYTCTYQCHIVYVRVSENQNPLLLMIL